MIFFSYLKTIIGIGFLIFIHELGHFIFCKIFRIPVAAFKIGRGTEIWSTLKKNTKYSIGLLPLGGYVAIGESNNPEEEVSILNERPWYQGILVILGGILNNLLFTYFVIIYATFFHSAELSKTPIKLFVYQRSIQITNKSNNQIEALAYHSTYDLFHTIEKEKKFLLPSKNTHISCTIETFKTIYDINYSNFTYGKTNTEKFFEGIKTTNNIIRINTMNLISSIYSVNFKNFSGPIGIIKTCTNAAKESTLIFMIFLALISTSLAILNLLPIPIVDGGQLILLLTHKIYGKKIPDRVQLVLTYGSFFMLAFITLYSTYNDIIKFVFK